MAPLPGCRAVDPCRILGGTLDEPKRIMITKPLIGDEVTIEKKLFGFLTSAATRRRAVEFLRVCLTQHFQHFL
jgi:hypothetical protein